VYRSNESRTRYLIGERRRVRRRRITGAQIPRRSPEQETQQWQHSTGTRRSSGRWRSVGGQRPDGDRTRELCTLLAVWVWPSSRLGLPDPARVRFFYFNIFYFRFLQKYIFDMKIYRNIPRPPRCRAAGTWPPGCRAAGAYLQKKRKKIADRSLGTGRPAAGRPASQAARLGGRPAPPPPI